MDFEEFCDKYKPVKNKFDESAGFDGLMFETYGQELEFVQGVFDVSEGNVWTMVEGDDGMWVVSGMREVNRFGYFVTKVARNIDEDIVISTD